MWCPENRRALSSLKTPTRSGQVCTDNVGKGSSSFIDARTRLITHTSGKECESCQGMSYGGVCVKQEHNVEVHKMKQISSKITHLLFYSPHLSFRDVFMCLQSNFRQWSVLDFAQSHWKNGHFFTATHRQLHISSISTLQQEFRESSDSQVWDKAQRWAFQCDLDKPEHQSKPRADLSKCVFIPRFFLLHLLHFNFIGKISQVVIFFSFFRLHRRDESLQSYNDSQLSPNHTHTTDNMHV